MSEMVERVARAICRSNCSPRMSRDHIECQVENAWDMWIPEARAAIEAMREPTIKMASQGLKEWQCATDTGDLDTDAHDMELIWKAMIQASLGDG